MAKITLNLDERTIKNGCAAVRLRINHGKTAAYIPTGVAVEPKYFQPSLYDPINRKAPNVMAKRERIVELVLRFDSWLLTASDEELAQMTAKDIRTRLLVPAPAINKECVPVPIRRKPNDAQDFVVHFGKYADSRLSEKTRKSYTYAWNVLREYCHERGVQTLYFADVNYQRLGDLARWLRETGKGEATRHMIESSVRAAYKEAQKMHIVDRANDPYFDYSIAPVPQKDIECLTAEQLRALMELDLSATAGLERARDCALMSFYLCGANLLDIYNLPPMSGEVVFVRHKVQGASQRALHIRIEPELQALLDKYKGTEMLLRFAERTPNYDTFQSKVNHLLREVSKKLRFKVTMAMIRRSWASVAGSLDISDRVIDKSMGHLDASVKDRHYEQYDWSRTARANRAVIDAVRGLS